jgi:hypothetical protein
MKELSLRDVLRYGVAGGIILLTLALIEGYSNVRMLPVATLGGATALLGLALVLGAVLYSAHRAAIFPFILRAQLRFSNGARELLGCSVQIWTIVSEEEMRFDELRWKEPEALKPNFSEWGDQMHLLYTSGEGIALGLLVELIAPNGLTLRPSDNPDAAAVTLLIVSVALFLAGIVSQRRLLAATCRMLLQKKKESNASSAA